MDIGVWCHISVQKIIVYICEYTRLPVLFQNMVRGTQTVKTNSDETFPEKYNWYFTTHSRFHYWNDNCINIKTVVHLNWWNRQAYKSSHEWSSVKLILTERERQKGLNRDGQKLHQTVFKHFKCREYATSTLINKGAAKCFVQWLHMYYGFSDPDATSISRHQWQKTRKVWLFNIDTGKQNCTEMYSSSDHLCMKTTWHQQKK